jgi:hypothetical protein
MVEVPAAAGNLARVNAFAALDTPAPYVNLSVLEGLPILAASRVHVSAQRSAPATPDT